MGKPKKASMSLGDRMRQYEQASIHRLPRRLPTIVRVDGKSFHTWTKQQKLERPFDDDFRVAMAECARFLCQEIATCVGAYTQSDEISLLLHPYKQLETQPYCDNRLDKICSHTSSYASSFLTLKYGVITAFHSKAWVLPESEVVNYFIDRQQDCIRNSIQMVGRSKFSQKQLHGKSCKEIQEMLHQEHGINWSKYETDKKRGIFVKRVPTSVRGVEATEFKIDFDIPEFAKSRSYIEALLAVESD